MSIANIEAAALSGVGHTIRLTTSAAVNKRITQAAPPPIVHHGAHVTSAASWL